MKALSIISVALVMACLSPFAGGSIATEASASTRTLKLYFLHTGERAEITYKRNGKYVRSGLNKINRFLRDWRRNEPTKMDPRLLDLVWEVYRESGSRKHIHVISGYRSPKTNSMLRKRGRGVASKSQHTYGKALDFYLPDVKLSKLRRIGLIKQAGGVGYYPKSGSPFVHLDTGRVRHWPRMSRSQLARVFPNGKTLHVPSDGKPLKGYNIAKARYDKRKRGQGQIVVSNEKELPKTPKPKRPNFFQRLVSTDEQDDNDNVKTPAPKPVKTTVEKPKEPAPEEAPVATEEELVIASLPETVPVPSLAPRTPQEVPAVVADEPGLSAEQAAVIAQVDELVSPSSAPEAVPVETPEVAVVSVPDRLVPEPRPSSEFETEQSSILALADPSQEPTTLRAAVSTTPDARPADVAPQANALATLTPLEIQDIRARLRDTYGASDGSRPDLPRPSQSVGAEQDSKVELASFDRFAPNKENVGIDAIKQKPIVFAHEKIAQEEHDDGSFVTASLAPVPAQEAREVLIGIPTPKPARATASDNPELTVELEDSQQVALLVPNADRISASSEISRQPDQERNQTLLAELKRLVSDRQSQSPAQQPLEPELVKTGIPALPSENPARLALAAIVEPADSGDDPSYVVSLLPIESELSGQDSAIGERFDPIGPEAADVQAPQIASLSPIEPGVESTDQIALPISNPERLSRRIEILNKLAEQAKEAKLAMLDETDDTLAVGSISIVPTPRPGLYEEGIELASLRDDLVLDFEEDEIEGEVEILPRINRSLAEFSMPDFSDSGIGKFALANDRSIREISEIRPPAYGRNAILELPSAVLTAGFSQNPDVWKTNRFTGRAVQQVAFAKFEK